MARTPSMTTEQCESELGRRGDLRVTSENRHMVRKWLSAQGFPGLFAGGLSMTELGLAYNQVDGKGLEKLREKLAAATDGMDSDEITISEEDKADIEREKHHATNGHANGNGNAAAIANAIKAIAESVVPQADIGALKAEVMAMVEAKLADIHISRIELTRQDGTVHTVEGHCHPQFEALLKAAMSRQANGFHPNIMLCGPTGSGKTHAVNAMAKALGLEFYTNGALTMDHQVIGFIDAAGKYHETPFRKAFGRPAAYLFDEMDSSDNSPLLCLAGGLANGHAVFPDTAIERHPDSVIIAAGNTWGHGATSDFVGRNKIDGAIRSRFPVRIFWDYDEKLETAISGNPEWAKRVQKARANARKAGLKVIIDPRMTQAGAALIAQGFTAEEAAGMTYLADLTPEQRRMVDAG